MKYDYKDVYLVPQYSRLKTRKDADVSVQFLGKCFKLPIIPANMKCVIDEERAKWLDEHNYFYIMHRFDINVLEFIKQAQDWNVVSISVGVNGKDRELLQAIVDNNLRVDFITIDIAHGHSLLMKEMLGYIKNLKFVTDTKIIAGNICTFNGFEDIVDWGADAVKVGIGGGASCSTKNKTGFTYPMFSCIADIALHIHSKYHRVPLIADGGIKEHGDIAKAIHAGASMVMAGGLFSRVIDSPADMVDGKKVYYGSASQYNKKEYRHVEGKRRIMDVDPMTYEEKLLEIEQDLQSAVSYAGGKSLYDIRNTFYIVKY